MHLHCVHMSVRLSVFDLHGCKQIWIFFTTIVSLVPTFVRSSSCPAYMFGIHVPSPASNSVLIAHKHCFVHRVEDLRGFSLFKMVPRPLGGTMPFAI